MRDKSTICKTVQKSTAALLMVCLLVTLLIGALLSAVCAVSERAFAEEEFPKAFSDSQVTAAHAAASQDEFIIPPEGLTYDFYPSYSPTASYYAVTGIDMDWAEKNISKSVTEVIIKLGKDYENPEHGKFKVTDISDDAFHCYHQVDNEDGSNFKYVINKNVFKDFEYKDGGLAWFSIIGVDFSEAENIDFIGRRAFASTRIRELDLRNIGGDILSAELGLGPVKMMIHLQDRSFYGCDLLEDIYFPSVFSMIVEEFAFGSCDSLRVVDFRPALFVFFYNDIFIFSNNLTTVYINGIDIGEGSFFGSVGPENLIISTKESFLEEKPPELERYRSRMTYEIDVEFRDGEEIVATERKLYGRPADYVKTEKGVWMRDSSYRLPEPEIASGYYCKWRGGDVYLRETDNVTAQSITAEWQYGLRAEYSLPPGKLIYANAGTEALTTYLKVWLYSDGYTCVRTDAYIITLAGGATKFEPGENTIHISYEGLSVPIAVDITAVPYEPGGLSPWAIAGIVMGSIALTAGACGLIYFARRKKQAALSPVAANSPSLSEGELAAVRNILISGKNPQAAGDELPQDLTAREREVAMLLMDGQSNKEIAASLFVSIETVKCHIKNILNKSKCRSRMSFAAKYGKNRSEP